MSEGNTESKENKSTVCSTQIYTLIEFIVEPCIDMISITREIQ